MGRTLIKELPIEERPRERLLKYGAECLSNAELKRLNERLQLEKTYSELSAAEKKKNESFGKSILKDIAKSTLTESGKKLATGLMNAFVTDKILEKVVEKTNKK